MQIFKRYLDVVKSVYLKKTTFLPVCLLNDSIFDIELLRIVDLPVLFCISIFLNLTKNKKQKSIVYTESLLFFNALRKIFIPDLIFITTVGLVPK